MNKRIFKCKICGKEFVPNYRISSKRTLQYCRQECKNLAIKNQKSKFYNKTQLENAIKKEIIKRNKYLTKQDVCNYLKISSKTISKFRVSILSLNRECGMRKPKSVFEDKIKTYFFQRFSDCVEEKEFEDCLSPKGYKLKFDIYIPSKNLLIEADGSQHYDKNNPHYKEYYKQCDLIKNEWCIKHNIRLIRIKYSRNVTDKYIEKYIHNI